MSIQEPASMRTGSYVSGLQQVSAVLNARELLVRLSDSRLTPRVPREIRSEARALLRNFPISQRLRPVLEGQASLVSAKELTLPLIHR